MSRSVLNPWTVDHHCDQPSRLLRRRPWTCPMCRRTWTPEGKGTWRTEDRGGEIVSVTMRYPDGTEAVFGVGGDDRG